MRQPRLDACITVLPPTQAADPDASPTDAGALMMESPLARQGAPFWEPLKGSSWTTAVCWWPGAARHTELTTLSATWKLPGSLVLQAGQASGSCQRGCAQPAQLPPLLLQADGLCPVQALWRHQAGSGGLGTGLRCASSRFGAAAAAAAAVSGQGRAACSEAAAAAIRLSLRRLVPGSLAAGSVHAVSRHPCEGVAPVHLGLAASLCGKESMPCNHPLLAATHNALTAVI